ncbi:hypothetical protein CBF45_16245 [Bordetella sp. J329]|nr:hypothetical protein CBF45_16245 [Bordetella sp. J329]
MRSLLIPLALPLAVSLASLAPVMMAEAADATASARLVDFDVPAQTLDLALKAAAAQAGLSVAADQSLLGGRRSAPLHGSYSVQQGFERLLAGTGLRVTVSANLVAITAPPASAQPATELAPVLVTGNINARADIFTTPEMLARVTTEDLRRLPPRNTSDVLANVSGVFTSQGRSDPGVSVNIWGMQDFGRVNVMVDGTRQNFQKSGHGSNGQVYLDPALLSSVDIEKGPTSTVGGAGMIAGIVNFRTLQIDDVLLPEQTVGGRVQGSTGTNATHFLGHAAIGLRMGEETDFLAAVSRRHLGEFRLGRKGGIDHYEGSNNQNAIETPLGEPARATNQDIWSGLAKLGWRPSIDHRLQLSYVGYDTKFTNGDRLAVSGAAQYSVRVDTIKLEYDYQPANPWISIESSLYYTNTRRHEERIANEARPADSFALDFETNTLGGTLQNTAVVELGKWQLTSRTGGEFFHDWTSPKYNDHVSDNSSRDPAWYEGSTPKGKRTVASAFQSLTFDYDEWLRIAAGLRYDHFWLKGNGQMFMGMVPNEMGVRPSSTALYTRFEVDRSAYGVAPTLSLAVKPAPWAQLFVNYGEGLRPPAITETMMYGMHVYNMFPYYPSPGLKEERARTWQFGTNLNFTPGLRPNDALRVKAAWFENRVRNYIVMGAIMSPIATADCGGMLCPSAYVNLNQPAHFRGLDMQVDYDSDDFFANLNVTRVISKLDTADYNPFPLGSWTGYPPTSMGSSGGAGSTLVDMFYFGPPSLKIGLSGGVRLFDRRLELGARWRLERPWKEDTQSVWANQTVRTLDLWAGLQATRQLHLGLAVDNVLDRNYVEITGSGTGLSFAPGRTILGTLTYQF